MPKSNDGPAKMQPIEMLVRTLDVVHNNLALSKAWPKTLRKIADELGITQQIQSPVRYRNHLATLAANIAVRNQVMLLTLPGLEEETHTNAFFGILASYIPVLNGMASGSQSAFNNRHSLGLYWAHQQKQTEEPRTGADFGIITDIDQDNAKLTLFQAKRPKTSAEFDQIKASHIVRRGRPDGPEEGNCRDQITALQNILTKIKEGVLLADLHNIITESDLNKALDDSADSLFRSSFSYKQSVAFVATALRGSQVAPMYADRWCHYVQWPYGKQQNPWTLTVTEVLRHEGARHKNAPGQFFSDVLARALSSADNTVGLVLKKNDISALASTISSLLPDLLWGFTSSSEDGAISLNQKVNQGRELVGSLQRELAISDSPLQTSSTDQHTKETSNQSFRR